MKTDDIKTVVFCFDKNNGLCSSSNEKMVSIYLDFNKSSIELDDMIDETNNFKSKPKAFKFLEYKVSILLWYLSKEMYTTEIKEHFCSGKHYEEWREMHLDDINIFRWRMFVVHNDDSIDMFISKDEPKPAKITEIYDLVAKMNPKE